jgi:hypothetical protein
MLKAEEKLTYITPYWGTTDCVVVPYNRVNTQGKAKKSNPKDGYQYSKLK